MITDLKPVATGLGFIEAPVARTGGSALFLDIQKQGLYSLDADNKVALLVNIPGGPNGLAIGPDGAAYVCNNGHIYDFIGFPDLTKGPLTSLSPFPSKQYMGHGMIQRVDLNTHEVTTLYTHCDGQPLLTPDDIVFDSSAKGFWFTDSGIQSPDSIQKGGLYYALIDGSSITKVATIATANGVGLSPKEDILYVSDTVFGRLYAFDLDGPGKVQPPPDIKTMEDLGKLKPGMLPHVPGRVVLTLPGLQWVDSLKVDASGRVCIGTLVNSGITIFTPEGVAGDPVPGTTEFVAIPDLMTTNLCFGGPDMCDVWITASCTGTIYKGRSDRPGLRPAFSA
ncbi:SMP-30/gluconolactonase/LRE family protein [Tabrizicola sp. BL-A-41-H6]|uniref:SMP-30/gluconolactonase/LRE family protein n=1 Tax=Tabrizicola sp. BL-A-41-H6 TaxID=3421107 RepID=UPI003D66B5CB